MDLPNTSGEDKGEKTKAPEKRVRRFQPNWQDTYTWVYFDESVGKMFCRLCKDNPDVADPSSAYFTGGCCNFQIMSLQSHAKSKGHISAEELSRMKNCVEENVQTWSPDPDASSPSSSCGPALSLHQFAHPMHLYTNSTGTGTNYKSASDLISEGYRAMSERLLRNTENTRAPDGSVVFPNMNLGTMGGMSQGKQPVRASSTYQNSDAVESTRESPATSHIIIAPNSSSSELRCMFVNAHAVAKLCYSPCDYTWLCELDKAKGLDMEEDHPLDECLAIQKVIAQSETVQIRKAVEKCQFFSVVCDTFRGKTKDMLVFYLKTVDNGKQHLHLLGIEAKHASKNECFSKILMKVLHGELEGVAYKSKLIGVLHDLDMKWYLSQEDKLSPNPVSGVVCGDSGPVKIKTEPGVESLCSSPSSDSQSICTLSNLVSHRCLLHRIQSFVTDTIKPLPYDKRVSEVLRTVRQRCLELYPQNEEEDEGMVKCHRVAWPRDRQSHVLIFTKKYSKIIEILSKQKDKDDTGLNNMIELCKSKRFVKYIHFLCDLLGVLDNSFKTLSHSNASIGEVYESVSDTIDNVKKLQKRSGQQLAKVENDAEFQGYPLSSDDLDGFEIDRAFILTSIVADLAPRLCTLQEDKMAAMAKLTSLQQWPVETDHLKDYADEDLLLIVETYCKVLQDSGVDTDKCLMEWSQLKNHIRRRFSSPNKTSWESIIPTCKGKCENILAVLTFILTLPGQSIDVEKGFHYLENLKKGKKMKPDELRNQLRIYLSLPSIGHFDPEPYMESWLERTVGDSSPPGDGSPPKKRSRRVSNDEDDEAYPVFF